MLGLMPGHDEILLEDFLNSLIEMYKKNSDIKIIGLENIKLCCLSKKSLYEKNSYDLNNDYPMKVSIDELIKYLGENKIETDWECHIKGIDKLTFEVGACKEHG